MQLRSRALRSLSVAALAAIVSDRALAYDVSAPAILQDFENAYTGMQSRMPDFFAAGYGALYTPPPGRAESGNQSVGYDPYDRFDLGYAGNPTLYGTESGLKSLVNSVHATGGSSYIDLVWNHSGFSDSSTSGFLAAGGYPGLALTLPGVVDGDYHSAYATGDQNTRLAGLVDIDQSTNNQLIRQPTTASPDNIPGPQAGASPVKSTGLANTVKASNARFYPDTSLNPISVYDPTTGQSDIKIYPYNLANPMAGDPVKENALGYLMRNTQWLVQTVGVDGFRVDAAKNMPSWVLNYLDRATYRSSFRTLLNGQQENIFSFSEVFDSTAANVQPYIKKNINPSDPGTIGGNRDALDFTLYYAMQANLSGTTGNNDWTKMSSANLDVNDDGFNNGSQGVKFVSSQDNGGPGLNSVAYAYTLMMPGNALVYYNAQQFGTGRNFPQQGRGDALGGMYGSAITTLVDLRNRYGRGNYIPETIDASDGGGYKFQQHEFAFERQNSALVLLSNRSDAGYDTRTVHTDFSPGTILLEQTGNAHNATADPFNDIPQALVVNGDGTVNVKFLRSSAPGTSNFTGDGYLVYGLPTPVGSLSLTNVAMTMHNAVPTITNNNDANAYANATTRIADVSVIKSSTFAVQLNTSMVNVLGLSSLRDHDADGDSALFKIDDGTVILNGDASLDHVTPGDVSYGYQKFNTTFSPGYSANGGAGGNGAYAQTITTSQLSQGYHYLSVIAYRHNADSSKPPVYSDWKQTIYVDTSAPVSTVTGFVQDVPGTNENRQLQVTSVDGLANNVHTFLDLPFNLTDSQVLAQISGSTQANNLDVAQWQHYYSGVTNGNHSATVVTYKPDGTYNIQRFNTQQVPSLATSTIFGSGLGDLDFNSSFNSTDITKFTTVLQSNNTQFNPAADIDGDGLVNLRDTFLLGPILSTHNVDQATWNAFNSLIASSYVTNGNYTVAGTNVIYEDTAGTTVVPNGASLNASYVRGNTLNINANGLVTIHSNAAAAAGVSKVTNLTIAGSTGAWTGKLDLTNNDLIVQSNSANLAADFARVLDQVKTGIHNFAYDGNGITSSTAAAHVSLTTLAVIINPASINTWDSQPVNSTSILVKYTFFGDANVDGKVNGTDYTLIDNGFAMQATGWVNGDFNYDGHIDGSDYSLIDNAFNQQNTTALVLANTSSMVAVTASEVSAATSVPEPTSLTFLTIAATGLSARKRRGRN